jgi:hypothetical protein
MTSRRLLFLILLLPAPAFAWLQQGHWLVGELAAQRLTPGAREQVRELLAGEPDPTLGGVASWADALRTSDPDRFKATSRWHYINAKGGGCDFVVPRDCPDGNCVVSVIEAQRSILASRTQPLTARRDALKFLVHFVGDLHQPLHAGHRTDTGGNAFQISLRADVPPDSFATRDPATGAIGTNLHTIWDHYVLADARLSNDRYLLRLAPKSPRPEPKDSGAPLEWARESCALSEKSGFYPSQHVMNEDYLRAQRPLAERRIEEAAARLAALLNDALAE